MTDVTIRPVLPTDFTHWKPLWDGYNTFYGRHGDTALPDHITACTWQRFFDVHEPVYALLALQQERAVGLVHYLFHRSTILINPTCYLQDLFVAEHLRGKGIARQLIEAVYDVARQNQVSRVYWQTHETNHTAMQLYDKVAQKSGFLVYRKLIE